MHLHLLAFLTSVTDISTLKSLFIREGLGTQVFLFLSVTHTHGILFDKAIRRTYYSVLLMRNKVTNPFNCLQSTDLGKLYFSELGSLIFIRIRGPSQSQLPTSFHLWRVSYIWRLKTDFRISYQKEHRVLLFPKRYRIIKHTQYLKMHLL